MSEARSSHSELTRRGFLKAATVTAGVAGLAGVAGMTSADGWLAPTQANADPEELVAYTYHQDHCGGHCSLKCTVRDGRLCLIEPNDGWEDKHFRACCPKGLSEVQHVYSAERVQTPLKRVGERGSSEFVSVSWDEALSEISENVTALWDEYGKTSILVAGASESGNMYSNLQKIMGAQGRGQGGFDNGLQNGLQPMIGSFSASSEARDWTRSRTLLMMSNNYLESCMSSAKCFFEAQDVGCRIIVVDPNYSTTASKADEWVPIEAGTDAALFLGMATAIVENEWHDEASMKANTTFPFLVNVETGAHLRQTPTDDVAQPGSENPFMVWDNAASEAVAYTEAEDPSLEGEYEIDGSTYTTVFELFKKNCEAYTVQWASQKTMIPEEKIIDLARQVSCNTPTTISLGVGGSDKFTNSDIAGHAAGLLVALTDNYGKAGAGIGRYNAGWSASLASWKLPEDMKNGKQEKSFYRFPKEGGSVRGVISLGDMFLMRFANMNVTREWAQSLDFIVVIESYMTPSTAWADIVLPASTRFETSEEVENVKVKFGHLLLQEKVLDPLFDSKPDQEIERLIAKSLGFDGILPATSEEYTRYKIEKSTAKPLEGMTLDQLKQNQGILPLHGSNEIKDGWKSQIEKTVSGRIHVYFEDMLRWNQALPVWEEPVEWYPDNPMLDTYPLQFCQLRNKFFIHNQFCDATWVRQFYDPQVEMCSTEMEARGLRDGDLVRVFNDRGEFTCKAVTNEKMRPRTVGMIEGIWTNHMVSGNFQNVTNDYLVERGVDLIQGPQIPVLDTLVQVEKA